jgi:hypothetical protein
MEIFHRVGLNYKHNLDFISYLDKNQIKYSTIDFKGEKFMAFFDIAESNSNWNAVADLIKKNKVSDIRETFFSEDELRNATWARIMAFESGYAQPQNNWLKKQTSLQNLCLECGVYSKVNFMRIKGEPGLRKKSFMSLICHGDLYCTPIVFSKLEEIHSGGYEKWPVLIHSTGQPAETVSQLRVPVIADPGVESEKEDILRTCPMCGTIKYRAHMRGIMRIKSSSIIPGSDFMLTNEWFGDGHVAFREILISNRIVNLILDNKWQGFRMKVVQLV